MTRNDVFQYARDMSIEGLTTKDERILEAAGKEALLALANKRLWACYRQWWRLNTKGPYSTGTVAIAGDRKALTGTGTTFTSDMAGNLFVPNGENVVHKIASYSSATAITLEVEYQTVDATTFSSGATYKVYFYSYDLPYTSGSLFKTRYVQAVVTGDRSEVIKRVNEAELRSLWAATINTERPMVYHVQRVISTTDASETQKIQFWPAPDDTHVFDVLLDRWPSDFPSSGSGILDVPPYLEELYKSLLLYRLAHAHRAWASKMQVALADMSEHMANAKREDSRYAETFRIDDGGMYRAASNRRWVLSEYGS